jgi:hypothetical protein
MKIIAAEITRQSPPAFEDDQGEDQERRHDHEEVDDQQDDPLGRAAEVGRSRADDGGDHGRADGDRQGDHQRALEADGVCANRSPPSAAVPNQCVPSGGAEREEVELAEAEARDSGPNTANSTRRRR